MRYQAGDLLLDPVISRQFGDVTLNYQLYNLPVTLRIYPQQGEFTPKRVLLDGQSLAFTLQDNPYRSGAALIHRQEIEGRLTAHSQLEIYL